MMVEQWQQEFGVFPEGRYTAWASSSGFHAEVRDGVGETVVRRLRGESAWSDAVRKAGDLNSKSQK